MSAGATHRPVLLDETLALLAARPGETVVDGTLGGGGHAERLLETVAPEGRLIGLDRDPAAIERCRRRLARFGDAFVAVHADHRELSTVLGRLGVTRVDRLLLDLGFSSFQIDDPERGFSFRHDGPLDMRMNPDDTTTAADLLARLDEAGLARLLWRFGEERQSRRIARAIVRRREQRPLSRTRELAELIETTLGPRARAGRIHPATRTFQALRIAVNAELDELEPTIAAGVDALAAGGRIAVIAFHSLEDRIVKRTLRSRVARCVCPPDLPVCGCGRPGVLRPVTTRAVRPGADEIASNPRARSARLRVAERL